MFLTSGLFRSYLLPVLGSIAFKSTIKLPSFSTFISFNFFSDTGSTFGLGFKGIACWAGVWAPNDSNDASKLSSILFNFSLKALTDFFCC